MLETNEILEWMENITNPTLELMVEINNAIYKNCLTTIQKTDIENVLQNTAECNYLILQKYGENKELFAIEDLCKELKLKDAKYLIVIISQNGSLTLYKINEMLDIIYQHVDSTTKVIISDYIENRMWDDIKITGIVLK